jgi:DNA repair exonuclease SbcCD ATPase subunit
MHDAASLPTRIAHPKIEKAAAEYRRLSAELRATDTLARELELTRHIPANEDLDARAAAVRAGKPDPGTPASDARTKQIEEAASKAEALRRATEQSYAEFVQAFEEHRDELVGRAAAEAQRARVAFAGLVEQLGDGFSALRAAEAAQGWAAQFPQYSRLKQAGGTVPGLVAQSGDDMGWELVLDALRKMAEGPAPSKTFVMGGQVWPSQGLAA